MRGLKAKIGQATLFKSDFPKLKERFTISLPVPSSQTPTQTQLEVPT